MSFEEGKGDRRVASLCLVWYLWQERKRLTFEDVRSGVHIIKLAMLRYLNILLREDSRLTISLS